MRSSHTRGVAVLERRHAAAAEDALAVGDDEVGGAAGARRPSLMKSTSGSLMAKPGPLGAELGHHRADDGSDGSVVVGADRSDA